MKPTSLKAKITKALKQAGFKPAVKSKSSGVKNFYNMSAGFVFQKRENTYCLYFCRGNMLFQGMPVEQQDEKTKKMYDWLVANGYGESVAYGEETVGRNQAITLKAQS